MKTKSMVIFLLQLVLISSLVLSGCTSSAGPAAEDEAKKPIRVALVMASSISDMAWAQSMYEGLKKVQADMGGEAAFELVYSENMFKVPDAAAAIRDYASQGYDIVFAHGSQYGSSLQEIAPDFPKTTFAWGTEVNTFGLDNVYAYTSASEEGGYVNGIMAAMLTKSKTIGVTGPVEAGDIKSYVEGFIKGVASVDPTITVSETWTGSYSDVALMTEAAKTHIAAGADALTGSSQAVVGSIGAAKEAGDVLWFATQYDQSPLAPNLVVASQAYNWNNMINEMIAGREKGELGGVSYKLTIKNGGLNMVYNPQFNLPADVKAAADKAIEGIKNGTIVVLP